MELNNSLPQLILYFQVHQPRRLAKMNFLEIGQRPEIFDDGLNKEIIERISKNCYLPNNDLIRRLIDKYPGVKVCFSLSGAVIDQLAEYQPAVLASFRELALSGSVEFLGETYYHSLSSVVPSNEFIKQVEEHRALMEHHLGYRPSFFRNTGLVYSTSIGSKVAQLGFKGILCDGAQKILGGRSPHNVYKHPTDSNFRILFRNDSLSDEIAFRFSKNSTIDINTYLKKIYDVPGDSVTTLGLDYETFGEHNDASSGITGFLEKLISELYNEKEIKFACPSEVVIGNQASDTFDVQDFISWANGSKDMSPWLGTEMQRDAFQTLNSLEEKVLATHDDNLIKTWRNLQTSDHFYYMSGKPPVDDNKLPEFSHYNSTYEAFINYMNVLANFSIRLNDDQNKPDNSTENQRRHEKVPIWAQQYAAHVADTIG